MVATVIVVIDEAGNGVFEIAGQLVVFQQDAAFQREVPPLDLTRVMVIWLSARVAHAPTVSPGSRISHCDREENV